LKDSLQNDIEMLANENHNPLDLLKSKFVRKI